MDIRSAYYVIYSLHLREMLVISGQARNCKIWCWKILRLEANHGNVYSIDNKMKIMWACIELWISYLKGGMRCWKTSSYEANMNKQ